MVVAPSAGRAALQGMLGRAGWNVTAVRTWGEAAPLLKDAAVVISERDLPDGGWMNALNSANGPPLIVATGADAQLWAEVIQSGGHDVLAQPLDESDVLSTVRAAARTCSRNKQSRSTHIQARSL